MTTAIVSLNGNPFSDYMQTPTELKLKNDFKIHIAVYPISPKVWNDFTNKVDFKTEYERNTWVKNKLTTWGTLMAAFH
jgi:hypothetical protein